MSTATTYESAREELQQIVSRLESGGEDLANTMKLWARGEELAAICQSHLDGARQMIQQAQQKAAAAHQPDQQSEARPAQDN